MATRVVPSFGSLAARIVAAVVGGGVGALATHGAPLSAATAADPGAAPAGAPPGGPTHALAQRGPDGARGADGLPGRGGFFGWRAAVGDVDGDGVADAVLAAGGDWYPQEVMLFPGNRDWGFDRGEDGAWRYVPRFAGAPSPTDPLLHSAERALYSALRLGDLHGDPALEVVAASYRAYDGPRQVPAAGAAGAPGAAEGSVSGSGIRWWPDLARSPGGAPLLCGLDVDDFVLVDADYDGRLDLLVGVAGSAPGRDAEGACPGAAPLAEGSAPPTAPPPPGGRYVGLWLDRGGDDGPAFAPRPDWWMAVAAEEAGRPTRVGAFDLDQDGWLDLFAAFSSRATVVALGGKDVAALSAPAVLGRDPTPPRVWVGPPSPRMTTSAFAALLPASGLGEDGDGLDVGTLTGLPKDARFAPVLVENRVCVAETFCADCGVRAPAQGAAAGALPFAACAPGSEGCDACDFTRQRVSATRFPDGAVRTWELGTNVPAALAPLDLATARPTPGDASTWAPAALVSALVGGNPRDARLLALDLAHPDAAPRDVADGGVFAIDLAPFEDDRAANPLLTFRRKAARDAGPVVTLPAVGPPAVEAVLVGGKPWPRCEGRARAAAVCWREDPEARAVILQGAEGAPSRPVEVRYRAMADYDYVLASPDPARSSLVLWDEDAPAKKSP